MKKDFGKLLFTHTLAGRRSAHEAFVVLRQSVTALILRRFLIVLGNVREKSAYTGVLLHKIRLIVNQSHFLSDSSFNFAPDLQILSEKAVLT